MTRPIDRRRCIAGLSAMGLAAPLVARAQTKLPVVGWLALRARDLTAVAEGFAEGLRDAGFVEGRNLVLDYRSADGRYDRLPALATELVKRPVDVLAAPGGMPLATAAKDATSTTPVVFMIGSDPVELSLVKSFNR